jgi:hypothetical protein
VIHATGYRLHCDRCRRVFGEDGDPLELKLAAEREGWGLDLKLDGTRAGRGGKDYCPECRPTPREETTP